MSEGPALSRCLYPFPVLGVEPGAFARSYVLSLWFFILRQALSKWLGLSSNLEPSCLSLSEC